MSAPKNEIESSIQKWRVAADLAARLNCPHCHKPDTNDHYMHFCTAPTVVAARQQHHKLLTQAIFACKLKKTTAQALTAMYSLDAHGRHIDPGSTDDGACAALVDEVLSRVPKAVPARAALVALMKMGPSERTQGWFPKCFEHGMRLLGEPLAEARTFQSQVVRLAMETDMWTERCKLVHPDGTTGLSSRQRASAEYTGELERTGLRQMPVTRRFYMGIAQSKRRTQLALWQTAFAAKATGPMDRFVEKKDKPGRLSKAERTAIRQVAKEARRRAQPREVGTTPSSLTIGAGREKNAREPH